MTFIRNYVSLQFSNLVWTLDNDIFKCRWNWLHRFNDRLITGEWDA